MPSVDTDDAGLFEEGVVGRDSMGNSIMFSPAPRDSRGNDVMFAPN